MVAHSHAQLCRVLGCWATNNQHTSAMCLLVGWRLTAYNNRLLAAGYTPHAALQTAIQDCISAVALAGERFKVCFSFCFWFCFWFCLLAVRVQVCLRGVVLFTCVPLSSKTHPAHSLYRRDCTTHKKKAECNRPARNTTAHVSSPLYNSAYKGPVAHCTEPIGSLLVCWCVFGLSLVCLFRTCRKAAHPRRQMQWPLATRPSSCTSTVSPVLAPYHRSQPDVRGICIPHATQGKLLVFFFSRLAKAVGHLCEIGRTCSPRSMRWAQEALRRDTMGGKHPRQGRMGGRVLPKSRAAPSMRAPNQGVVRPEGVATHCTASAPRL